MFYRMMTLVANIRDLGGNDLDDHITCEDHVQSGFVSQWTQVFLSLDDLVVLSSS